MSWRSLFRKLAAILVAVLLVSCGGGGGDDDGGNNSDQSVCGGSVTSTPKLCELEPYDGGLRNGSRYVGFTYCVSDAEGDIDTVCVGVAIGTAEPEIVCRAGIPRGSRINECLDISPIEIGPSGFVRTWTFGLAVGDSQGHESNAVSTSFNCCN